MNSTTIKAKLFENPKLITSTSLIFFFIIKVIFVHNGWMVAYDLCLEHTIKVISFY
ncbi:hypothetical protein [Metabacillus endolithicus]|uniref:hypothetical protein n=1 Tax=Metabacillus endolithicus TaxID=1535204 RepID=UPI001FF7CC60|nr:hypothetical protein [Metabacillus endolithicus]UPG66017.1 hypothetical protein MVE64_17400 [Metabacillus endolithicus]